jgi:acyl carrier protein phosphodiesterase
MNLLAHAFLSFQDTDILAGNMISDYVKGKKQFDLPESIQKGIQLHRVIDQFTDQHPVIKELSNIFKPTYRLYSGAIIDVVLDHFLANDTTHFKEGQLHTFTQATYEQLDVNKGLFPDRFAKMFPFMHAQNWLFHYHTTEGIQRSLNGLKRRATYIQETDTAFQLFLDHYALLQTGYDAFFPDILHASKSTFGTLINPIK